MTHPMLVEKTYRTKFARQNFIKAEQFARQNSYFRALEGVTRHPTPPQKLRPCSYLCYKATSSCQELLTSNPLRSILRRISLYLSGNKALKSAV